MHHMEGFPPAFLIYRLTMGVRHNYSICFWIKWMCQFIIVTLYEWKMQFARGIIYDKCLVIGFVDCIWSNFNAPGSWSHSLLGSNWGVPFSMDAGKGKCCMWLVNKVELCLWESKWSNLNATGSTNPSVPFSFGACCRLDSLFCFTCP